MFDKSESNQNSVVLYVGIGLLVLGLILNSLTLYVLFGNSFSFAHQKSEMRENTGKGNGVSEGILGNEPMGLKKIVMDAVLAVEYQKSGGKENFETLTRAQQLSMMDPQNPSNLTAMKKYIETFGSGGSKTTTNTTGSAGASNLTPDEITKLVSTAAIEGNKSADVIAIEYSDMECPYCIKQYHDTKLQESLKAQYGDKVAFVFKNNRGVNHEGTEAKAIAALCAKKVGGNDAYAKFYHAIMDGTQQGSPFPVSKLADIAKKNALDLKKWNECVSTKASLSEFQAETAEAQKYNLNGTPGTLLLNVKTGKYTTVEGAYPFSTFTEKISSLM